MGTCTPPNPVENVLSTAGLGGRPRACKKHWDPLGIGSPVTGSSVHGGNDPPWLAPAVHGVEYPILDKRLWYQVPPFGGIWRQRPWISDCGIRCRLAAASGGSVQRIGYSILKPATARDYRL